jgi:hypothetical protein
MQRSKQIIQQTTIQALQTCFRQDVHHLDAQQNGEDDNLQLTHVMVLGLNEPGSKSGPRASANGVTPDRPDRY